MDLHANAALSLNKRRLLCRRVVEENWTLTKAAAAAEVSVRCARKWVGRYRSEGELTARPSSASRRSRRSGGCASAAPRSPSCSGWRSRPCRGS